MLAIIYTVVLGLLCTGFVEAGIYTFLPTPSDDFEPIRDNRPRQEPEGYKPTSSDDFEPIQEKRSKDELEEYQRAQSARRVASEKHAMQHYVVSLIGATLQTSIALEFHRPLGVIADGVLLGAVFTLSVGTWVGATGSGRLARFAVATVSLVVALVLGWLVFQPHMPIGS